MSPGRKVRFADRRGCGILDACARRLDYDFKRKLIDAHDDEALLTAQTIPWDTVADFEKARDDLEAWKHSQRRVLKTRSDYEAMISWAENVNARRAAGVKSDNSLGPLTAACYEQAPQLHFDIGPCLSATSRRPGHSRRLDSCFVVKDANGQALA